MKYIEWYNNNGYEAFLAKVSDNCYKAGISVKITSSYKTLAEAKEAYEHYKGIVERGIS